MSPWRRLLAVISPRWREPAPCEGCGAAFTCGASVRGCWCLKVELSHQARAQLRKQFDTCVCRDCLDQAAKVASP